jgi:type IV pilus assembly protein PilN
MATRINLLPWREEKRQQKQKEFYIMLAGALVLGVGVVYGGDQYYQGRIHYQEERNDLLRDEISQLDDRLEEIKELKETKKRLINRMEVIQDLQKGRPQIVHLFEQFVTTLPEGLYLESINEKGDSLTIEGVGESNARVSDYMENLASSSWLTRPDLEVVEVTDSEGTRISQFTLSVEQTNPREDDDDNGGGS